MQTWGHAHFQNGLNVTSFSNASLAFTALNVSVKPAYDFWQDPGAEQPEWLPFWKKERRWYIFDNAVFFENIAKFNELKVQTKDVCASWHRTSYSANVFGKYRKD